LNVPYTRSLCTWRCIFWIEKKPCYYEGCGGQWWKIRMLVWKKLARHVKATCYQRVRGLALWQNGGLRVEFFQGYKNFRSCSSNTDSNGVSKGDSSKVKSSNKKINTKGERKKRLFKLLPEEVNYDRKYYQNTFISTTRAMSDYLLKPRFGFMNVNHFNSPCSVGARQ